MPLDALRSLVREYRANARGRELEIRLGSMRDGGARFCPGVPREVFEQLEQDMGETLRAENPHYVELVDYYYTVRRNERIRTRVTFDTERIEMGREHVRKDTVSSILVPSSVPGGEAECCRVAVANEVPVATPPEVCLPTHVRVKQRRRFLDVRDGRVVWAYELSKTWSANSRNVVEHMQHVQEPIYEVECELVDDDGSYLASVSDADLARSLLLKSFLLMGEDAPGEDAGGDQSS